MRAARARISGLAFPQRIGALFYQSIGDPDDEACGTFTASSVAFRTFVLGNIAMVRRWSLVTAQIRERVKGDIAELHTAGLRRRYEPLGERRRLCVGLRLLFRERARLLRFFARSAERAVSAECDEPRRIDRGTRSPPADWRAHGGHSAPLATRDHRALSRRVGASWSTIGRTRSELVACRAMVGDAALRRVTSSASTGR